MPHYKQSIPSPHPENPRRTHTLIANTDCPRCGGSLDRVECEPADLLHCPHCHGALEACGRIEDGGQHRAANIVTISWLQPVDAWRMAGEGCICAGCTPAARDGEGR